MDKSPSERPADLLNGVKDHPMNSRDAADTLVGAVRRAGAPWEFLPPDSLAGRDLLKPGTRTWPLVLPDGEMLGIVLRDVGGPVPADELITVLLRTVASLLSAERAAAEAHGRAAAAERDARIDAMTGLLNRRAWDDAIAAESARIRRHDSSAAVIVVDIDELKATNDTHGHLAGDLLIQRAGKALRGATRDEDVVARIGGDEFGVLAVGVEAPVPETLIDRIRTALGEVDLRASAGAATVGPGGSVQQAFAEADREMYAAKRRRSTSRSA